MIDTHYKIERLAEFIGWSSSNRGSPGGDALRSGIFEHVLIGSGQESRRVVYWDNGERASASKRSIDAAIGRAAVIVQPHGHDSHAVDIGGGSESECAARSNGRLSGEEFGVIGGDDKVQE